MPTYTTTYSLGKPVVGADEDAWGDTLNTSLDAIDDILDGTTPVTGIDINSGTLDGVTIGGTTAGAGTFTTLTANTSITGTLATAAQTNITSVGTLTGLTVSGSTSLAGASTSADITFGDNDKAIFGAGSDLQIYHDGSNSFITDAGTGSLVLRGNEWYAQNADGTSTHISAINGGAVTLSHNNSPKLATTSTGIDVTGTVTADGLTVDTSTLHVDATNNRVGIGTSSPADGKLHVVSDGNASEVIGSFEANNGTQSLDLGYYYIKQRGGGLFSFDVGSAERLRISSGGDISFYEDTGTTAKFFWDASAESLGIGTTSPSSLDATANDLVVGGGSGNKGLTIFSGTSSTGAVVFADGNDGTVAEYRGWMSYDHSTDALRFATASAERMRIDSSGNLLVGKTNTSFGSAGSVITGNSYVLHTRDGAEPLLLERLTSDGSIVNFYKDGTTVGSIGSSSIGGLEITGNNSSRSLLLTTNFFPANGSGAKNDGVIDLGISDARWRNLYLSGGVYLGGTGSANHLDDYEEGTFTPVLVATGTDFSGVTHGTQSGAYTKIGNQVTVRGVITASVVVGGSGALAIGNMPFTSSREVAASLGYISGINFDSATYDQINLYMPATGGGRLIFTLSGDNAGAIELPISNFTSSFNCIFTATYVV